MTQETTLSCRKAWTREAALRRRTVLACGVVWVAVILFATFGNWVALAAEPGLEPSASTAAGEGLKRYPYINPVYPADAPDPGLLRVGEYFYAAVTGEKLLRSKDLVHWEYVGRFFARYPAWVDPASPEVWAPELQYIGGKYLLYFSARVRGYQEMHRGIGVAWADRPEGPYTPLDEPLVWGPGYRHIDQHLFQDDDGTWYMYWGSDHQPILVQEVAPDGLSLLGEPTVALEPLPYLRYSRLVEGPWVIKRGPYYYIFWSGDGYFPGEYAVSVARATSPLGPFERYTGNPILIGDLTWASPGHNAIIRDDAGRDWIVYHAYDWTDTGIGRMLMIDPLIWQDGWPRVRGRVPSVGLVEDGPAWKSDAIPLIEVAGGKPVEASSSRSRHQAEFAVDRETKTSWLPAEDDPEPWIVVDLEEPRRIARLDLRFGKSGDRRYRIEVSQDGSHWEVVVDHWRVPANHPVEEVEATARYVRVRFPGPVKSDEDALREVRVFAYQRVWIASPTVSRLPSPFEIRVHVDPDLEPKSVVITLNGETLYSDTTAPGAPSAGPNAGPLTSPFLPDGVHRLTLEVVDRHGAVWRHDVQLRIVNATILEPEHGASLQGESIFRFRTGEELTPGSVVRAKVTLAPIRSGEVYWDEAVTLYDADRPPALLAVDTEALMDGTYQLTFEVTGAGGVHSESAIPVIIKNWERLLDPFEPPLASGWFGVLDRKKTVEESPGWEYDTSDPSAFFGDRDRRIWKGEGVGHLVWESPGPLHGVRVTLYVRDTDSEGSGPGSFDGLRDLSGTAARELVEGLELAYSRDRLTWAPVSWEVVAWERAGSPSAATMGAPPSAADPGPATAIAPSPTNAASWIKVELSGLIQGASESTSGSVREGICETGARYLRLSLPAEFGAGRVQLGHVELTYRDE